MGFRIVQTLGPKDAGNIAAALASIPKGDTKTVAYLGVIIGKANGLSYRSNKYSDEPSVALTGVFESTPYDPDAEVVQGSSLFLNEAVQKMLVSTMLGDQKPPVEKAPKLGTKIDIPVSVVMPIRVEIGIQRQADENADKYKFVINIVGNATKNDDLEEMRNEVVTHGNERMRAIANRGAAHPQLAPPKVLPTAAAGKGKGTKKK